MNWLAVWRWWRVPSLVLSAALALTFAATVIAHREVVKRDAVRFRKSADEVEALLTHQLDTYVALLDGTAGLFAADEVVTAEEFHAYLAPLDLRHRYPGIQGIGYAARVEPDARAAFQNGIRLTEPTFAIHPDPGARIAYPVTFLEPADDRNRAAMGFDMYAEPTRAAAMDRARDEGVPTASAQVKLVQEIDGSPQAGFLIYRPLYRGGGVPSTELARRAAHCGFAYAPFRADDLLSSILAGSELALDVELYDGTAVLPSAMMHRPAHPAPGPAGFEEVRPFVFAGHRWTIVCRSRPELLASRALATLIALGGIVASGLLFATALVQARAHERSERDAAELRRSEHALKRSEERLRFLANASAILGSSLEYQKTLVNVASLAVPTLADWTAVDLIGDDGALHRLTVAHPDPAKVALAHELYRRWPPGPDEPPHTVMAARQPLFVPEITDAMLAGAARDPDHLRILRQLGLRSALIVPLVARDRVLGAITFVTADSGRRFGPEDAAVGEELARRSAAAIDNARLYAEAEQVSARLAQHADELTRSNAELEQFAYVASHDLQEPLRMINNYLDLLLRRYGDRFAGQPAEYMAFAVDGARRMQALIKDLLSFSRAGRSADEGLGEVDAGAALDEALKNLARSIEESGATIERAPLPRVVFDRLQLLQLFQNLVGNAIKFRGEHAPRVSITAARREGEWEFAVHDNGIGIDPAHAARVFEVFQRLHGREQYPGTGIGLAICRKIVERRGGRIWVESLPGQGATFKFSIPDRIPGAERPPLPAEAPNGIAQVPN